MSNLADLSDDEILTLATAPEDNVPKQRKRARMPAKKASPLADVSDEEILAAAGVSGSPPNVSRGTSAPEPYHLTDYAPAENKAGPSTDAALRDTDARLYGEALDRVEGGKGPATWEDLRRVMPESRMGQMAAGRPQDVPDSPEYHAHQLVGMLTGHAVGGLLGPALEAVGVGHVASGALSGGAAGAAQAASAGEGPRDILAATIMGGGLQALAGGRGARPAHPPLTQAEMDAATLQRAPREPPGLPEGEHGTVELSRRANAGLDARVAAREGIPADRVTGQPGTGLRGMMDEGDADFSALDQNYPVPSTTDLRDRIEGIRHQSLGPAGANPNGIELPHPGRTLDSDPILAGLQANLRMPGGAEFAPREALRNVQKGMNEEAKFAAARGAKMSDAALQQAAGAIAGTARAADPRLGPGNLGGILDKYGAETDALRRVDELRGPEGSRIPRLARTGAADMESDPAALQAEHQTRQLQQEEPASNDLIDMIRARNTQGRRGLQLPNYMGGSPAMGALRALRANGSNLLFKLNPPTIDAAGQVAARSANPASLAMPLELQLLLMQRQRQENPNAGQ